MPDFLLEIGLEEVPARMLADAEMALLGRVISLLSRERLTGQKIRTYQYSTPRRLAVQIENLVHLQPDIVEQLTGPAWSVAFKDGEPTPAAHAFAKKAGVSVGELEPFLTAKGKYVAAGITRPGRPTAELLTELLPREIAALPWPKPMYWRAGKPERFVRPVQWLVALLDGEIIPMEFAGIHAGRESRGHRILHGAVPVVFATPAGYAEALRAAHVEPDVETRRHTIRKALDQVTRDQAPAARWREDHALVDTVTHLTEWPSVLLGRFEPEFLALPEEVLVTVMRDHQKYFALEDSTGKLLPHFLTVLNAKPNDVIRHGNERVLRARFSDARFFWDFDRRTSLDERRAQLAAVTFQKDLGSYATKTARTLAIAGALADAVQRNGTTLDRAALDRAAELAKVDLTTELVKEFTELQGIVGGLYARAAGEPEAVAQAIYHQYRPAAITDPIPPTVEGQILGLADRIGTLADLFALGLEPSGSRDPYALRRAANAIVKILAISKLPLRISDIVNATIDGESVQFSSVTQFLTQRVLAYACDVERLPADVVQAVGAAIPSWEPVLISGWDDVQDLLARSKALAAMAGSDDLAAISIAWKRMLNILSKDFSLPSITESTQLKPEALVDEAEKELWINLSRLIPVVEQLRKHVEYRAALEQIALLRPFIDDFFDTVLVMADNSDLRLNRLKLLQIIVKEFGKIAYFSELIPQGRIAQ